ncbi:hypothetical protein ACRALDRAFT_2111939 [Sodiomyces alcalophilus JCM 7366]|uniref:uncharacterized protein n=1 Tax=Sodiomyces alcalophilus JCM 7366 TaxID=591952 RepID=UPI0039B68383
MDTVVPTGGFQPNFQSRLSRLYDDTKKSSDFVTQTVQNTEDPDIKALHRKLRIQKDRFVSWGVEWSDPSHVAEIDESLSRAGLSEVVGSILSTIKDILAEAEPLWQSSRGLLGSGKGVEKPPSGDRKTPLVAWDKGRFEDLIRDLTTSIDTLYDLSRTRSSAALSSQAARPRLHKSTPTSSSADELRPFEPSRMQTPQQIDPSTLTSLPAMQGGSTTSVPRRQVVYMNKRAWSGLCRSTGPQPWAPLLLEYAPFDSIYATTGIMPSMSRFEKLSAGLQQESQRSPGAWTGLPRLLGYFEDVEHARLGLVYRFPRGVNAVSLEDHTQNQLSNLSTLSDLLMRPDFEPRLEAKFRLAYNLVNTVFDLHTRGITHGSLIDCNVSFCHAEAPGGKGTTITKTEVDVRRPLVSSFDVFPDASPRQEQIPFLPLYRHPLDPRTTPEGPIGSETDTRILDLYSLAMLLVSIGLWTKLENLVPDPTSPSIPESILEQLAIRCGTLYMKAVQVCWDAVDQELAGRSAGEELLSTVQVRATRYLEACCILDGVSGLDDRPSHHAIDAVSSSPQPSSRAPPPRSKSDPAAAEVKLASRASDKKAPPPPPPPRRSQSKLRLYPHVPLPPEAVEHWNAIIMPQINQALRHFYRKHPESVEISLQPIGVSPQKAKPTVLVVCTSVGKVKTILTRKMGELFDGNTGFGLKVCRGQVIRSRKLPVAAARSKADAGVEEGDESEPKPANPGFQPRPNNGASIGAWIGDRHLPPVSFGGLILIDNQPYGMTVHHMLDDQDAATVHHPQPPPAPEPPMRRSMARPDDSGLRSFYGESSHDTSESDDFACEFSDSDSEGVGELDFTSEESDYEEEEEEDDDDDDDDYNEPGDIPGIEPGCGDGYIITQPAMDDVDEDFYPVPETADEDHLDSFSLGTVYASSGIRRREQHGLVHEIDWALFSFQNERLPSENAISHPDVHSSTATERQQQRQQSAKAPGLRPSAIVPSSALPGMEVQCVARTSGTQTGTILPALASIKMQGRVSPSHTFQVRSSVSVGSHRNTSDNRSSHMGVPGDSGAWVLDRRHGRVCGHVLAFSTVKKTAYICPMDVLLLDIAETLGAVEVRLPGAAEAVVRMREAVELGGGAGAGTRQHGGRAGGLLREGMRCSADVGRSQPPGGEPGWSGMSSVGGMAVPPATGPHGRGQGTSSDLSRRMESLGIGVGTCS